MVEDHSYSRTKHSKIKLIKIAIWRINIEHFLVSRAKFGHNRGTIRYPPPEAQASCLSLVPRRWAASRALGLASGGQVYVFLCNVMCFSVKSGRSEAKVGRSGKPPYSTTQINREFLFCCDAQTHLIYRQD